MGDHEGEEPDSVLPFLVREPAPDRPRRAGVGRVTELYPTEPAEPWRGDEEWVSTLADSHDTTKTDEPE